MPQKHQHGSARFAATAQAAGLTSGKALSSVAAWTLGRSGGWLSRPVGLDTWPTGRNWLILGAPRSGKGANFFVPTLLSAGDQPTPRPSILITDPKGELLALARDRLSRAGYAIHVVAFDQPDLSGGFDPLPWLRGSSGLGPIDYGSAQHFAQTLVPVNPNEKDPFWGNAARLIVSSAAVLALRSGGGFADALGLAYRLALESSEELVDQIAPFARVDPWAGTQMRALVQALAGDQKLAANISADLVSKFAPWTTPAMLSIFSRPGPEWDTVLDADQPTAVFLLAAAHHASQQAVVVASLLAAAHHRQRHQNRLARPLWLLLDEFGNIGYIPNLLDALTTLPGAGVSLALGVQSIPQVEAVYGQSAARVALEAIHGMLVYPGLGYDSAKWVSERLGTATISQWSASQSSGGTARSWSQQSHARALATPDEISSLRGDRVLVLRFGAYALKLQSSPYYRDRRYAPEARLADPQNPQIAQMLDRMRQPLDVPPGAWDLGTGLLTRLEADDVALAQSAAVPPPEAPAVNTNPPEPAPADPEPATPAPEPAAAEPATPAPESRKAAHPLEEALVDDPEDYV